MKIQPNDDCPCGSGKKYKNCCFAAPKKKMKPKRVYRLKVELVRIAGQFFQDISRTFELEGDSTLYDFHLEIQDAFNWDNDHMFSFYMGNEIFDNENEYSGNPLGIDIEFGWNGPEKSAAETKIKNLRLKEKSTFLYLFDFGDQLLHKVTVEKIREKNDDDKNLPLVVNSVGTAPPQYGFDDEDEEDYEEVDFEEDEEDDDE
jgi:hypothetical protein